MSDPRTRPDLGRPRYERPRPVQAAPTRLPRPCALEARARRGKPESNALRMVLGLAGLASASALATAMLPSIAPQPIAGADAAAANQAQPDPSVVHVTRVVQLAPGQTLPPDLAAAASAPAAAPAAKPTARPTPRIIYQTITRQSGKP